MKNRWVLFLLIGLVLIIGAASILFFSIYIHGSNILVEWDTASEINTLGFNIYRSDSINGERIRINEYVIPTSADPLIGGHYKFIDEYITPGKIYYYYLEEVGMDGYLSLSGPIEVQAESLISSTVISFIVFLLGITIIILGLRMKYMGNEGN